MPKKIKVIHLSTPTNGIVAIIRKPFIKRLFCDHTVITVGYHCSAHGLQRINGADIYTVCIDCGKIINEQHTDWR